MNLVPDGSVHLIVTSPPHWQPQGQSYESYIDNLSLVWAECYRVLHDGCRLCINIGDRFARSVYYGRYKVIPVRTEIIKYCENLGMDYMGAIIWQKQSATNSTGGGTAMGSYLYPRNGILKMDYEFILLFKKQGDAPKPTVEQKQQSEMTKAEWNTYFSSHWTFGGVRQEGNLSLFPEELPTRLIKMFSFVGETILDPFLGSGTTTVAAQRLRRNSIGYEIDPTTVNLCKQKLGINEPDMFGSEFVVEKDVSR
jgi:site-specific DNA-methyltransferase (adenine-specific)